MKKQIIGGDGKTLVWVYDGDVNYVSSGKFVNYCSYKDSDNIKQKTTLYKLHSNLTARLNQNSENKCHVTYKGVSMSDEFANFDRFSEWCSTAVGFMKKDLNGRVWHLDKDLLSGDVKYYSAETCCFIPDFLNTALASYDKSSFNSKVNNFKKVYEDDIFSELDERVLDKLIEMSAFNFGLDKSERLTVEDYVKKEEYIKNKSYVYSLIGNMSSWNDVEEPLSGISFRDGFYSVNTVFKRDKMDTSKNSSIVDAVNSKIKTKRIILNLLKDEFESTEFWLGENLEGLISSKFAILDRLEYLIKEKEIKLKQWVQVEV